MTFFQYLSVPPNTPPYFPFDLEGDPGQYAGHAQDAGGNGEVQGRAPGPSGVGGEPAGLLQSWTAAEGPGRAGAPNRAAGQAAGGRAESKSRQENKTM